MLNALPRYVAKLQRFGRYVLLFCALRLAAGVAMIAILDRGAVAWDYEATIVVIAAIAIYVAVALAVRRWAPPRRTSPDSRCATEPTRRVRH